MVRTQKTEQCSYVLCKRIVPLVNMITIGKMFVPGQPKWSCLRPRVGHYCSVKCVTKDIKMNALQYSVNGKNSRKIISNT